MRRQRESPLPSVEAALYQRPRRRRLCLDDIARLFGGRQFLDLGACEHRGVRRCRAASKLGRGDEEAASMTAAVQSTPTAIMISVSIRFSAEGSPCDMREVGQTTRRRAFTRQLDWRENTALSRGIL
jgi:hypothetical protein